MTHSSPLQLNTVDSHQQHICDGPSPGETAGCSANEQESRGLERKTDILNQRVNNPEVVKHVQGYATISKSCNWEVRGIIAVDSLSSKEQNNLQNRSWWNHRKNKSNDTETKTSGYHKAENQLERQQCSLIHHEIAKRLERLLSKSTPLPLHHLPVSWEINRQVLETEYTIMTQLCDFI